MYLETRIYTQARHTYNFLFVREYYGIFVNKRVAKRVTDYRDVTVVVHTSISIDIYMLMEYMTHKACRFSDH